MKIITKKIDNKGQLISTHHFCTLLIKKVLSHGIANKDNNINRHIGMC